MERNIYSSDGCFSGVQRITSNNDGTFTKTASFGCMERPVDDGYSSSHSSAATAFANWNRGQHDQVSYEQVVRMIFERNDVKMVINGTEIRGADDFHTLVQIEIAKENMKGQYFSISDDGRMQRRRPEWFESHWLSDLCK